MAESHNWFVRRGKKVLGPFPAGIISRYVLLGRLRETDEVSHDREEWRPIRRVPALIPDVVRAARANPDDPEVQEHLKAARRWADERDGPSIGKGERREGGEGWTHPVFEDDTEDLVGAKPRNHRDYLLVAVIVLALVAVPFVLPSRQANDEPQCDAPPASGVNWSNCRLAGSRLPNVDLSGAILRNAELSRAVLRAANLSQADAAYTNFTLANLRGANLSGAKLLGATLRGADLSHANLSQADLSYANLSDARLEGTDLSGAKLGNAVWAEGVVCMPDSVGQCRQARAAP